MSEFKCAFVKALWHAEIVDNALVGFHKVIDENSVDVFTVPGALEMPLIARDLARSGRYEAVVAAAFVVDGGIYRHEFVAQAVVNGLVQVGLETNVPIFSVSLTPHQYQETEHHKQIYREHFIQKGEEAGRAVSRTVGVAGISAVRLSDQY